MLIISILILAFNLSFPETISTLLIKRYHCFVDPVGSIIA
jgi:hypothetical protein